MAINFGNEFEFLSAGSAEYISTAASSISGFIVIYKDVDDAGHGIAKIGTVSGTDITFGSGTEFLGATNVSDMSVSFFDPDKFVVLYEDSSDSSHGKCKVGTISGTDITFGDEAILNIVGPTKSISSATLSTSGFVVVYQDQNDFSHGTARIGTISGTDVTFGSDSEFLSAFGAFYINVATINATKFVVAYKDVSDAGYGKVKIGTVSGTDITFGDETIISIVASMNSNSIAILSDTKFVIAYETVTLDGCFVRIGTISGTTITFGDEIELITGNVSSISVTVLSPNKFIVSYGRDNDGVKGKAKVGTVVGTDVTLSEEIEFNNGTTTYISTNVLSRYQFIVAYNDGADSGHGTVKIGSVDGLPVLFNDGRYTGGCISRLSDNKYVIAYADSTDGEKCKTVVCDRTDGQVSVGPEQVFADYSIVEGAFTYLDMDAVPLDKLWPSGNADRIYIHTVDVDGIRGIHKCGSVSGQTINWGSSLNYYASAFQRDVSVTAISSGHIGITYQERASFNSKLKLYSTYVDSDKNITKSNVSTGESVHKVTYNQTQVIDPDNNIAVMTYRHLVGSSRYGKARIIDYSTDPPTNGSAYTFLNGGTTAYPYGMRTCPLSPTKFILGYSTDGANASGYMVVGEVDGTIITFGSPFAFGAGNSVPYISQQRLGDDKFIFTYSDQSDGGKGKWMIGEVVDTTITYTQSGIFSEYEVHNDDNGNVQCTALTHNAIAIAYNQFDSASGYTLILSLPAVQVQASGDLFIGGWDNVNASDDLFIHGFEEIAASGDLYIKGIPETQSINASGDLYTCGHNTIQASGDLYIQALDLITTSGDLYSLGYKSIQISGDLFVQGRDNLGVSGDLFVKGYDNYTTSGNLYLGGCDSITTSGDLFTRGRDTRYCLYSDNVIFYHPCDSYEEDTIQEMWNENTVTFSGGLISSGVITSSEAILSYDNQNGIYPLIENATSFAIAFWSKRFFRIGPDAEIFIGNSSSSSGLADENGIHLHGNAGKPMIHINGTEGKAVGSFNPTPNDDEWHFLVVYAEISGGNWHVYGSMDGADLNHLANDTISTTAMSGQRYMMIHLSDPNDASPPPIIDEVICWTGLTAPFTPEDINHLYHLGYTYGLPLDSFILAEHIDKSINLYTCGAETLFAFGTLFVNGYVEISGILAPSLFVHGQDILDGSGSLFIHGCKLASGSHNLFTTAVDNINISGDLLIEGCECFQSSGDLFVHGCGILNTSGDLYAQGYDIFQTSGDLFIKGCESAQVSGDLFLEGHVNQSISGDLYTYGVITIFDQYKLFIHGSGLFSADSSYSLFINGYEPRPALTCPTLDPTASIQIKASLITTYQELIDDVIDQLGKTVRLEFDPTRSPCPNCEFDIIRKRSTGVYKIGGPRPFSRGRKCPYCKGHGFTETSVTKDITCLTRWNPTDAVDYGIAVSQMKDIVRLKTYLTEADDLVRAKTIIVNYDIIGQITLRARLIQGPIPIGLREDRYCITFWELI